MRYSILAGLFCVASLARAAVGQEYSKIADALSIVPQASTSAEATEAVDGPYRFCWCRLMNGSYVIMRWEPDTGRCWARVKSMTWRLTEEIGEPPRGPYEVVVLPNEDGKFWGFRFNLRTGQDWHLGNWKWQPTKEPEE